jgi:hypothetical protein
MAASSKISGQTNKKWKFASLFFMQQIVNIFSSIIENFYFNCSSVDVNINYLETLSRTIILYQVIPQGPPWFQWLNLCLPTSPPIIGNRMLHKRLCMKDHLPAPDFIFLKCNIFVFWFTSLLLQCDLTSSASNLGFISFSTGLSFKSNKTMTRYIYQSNIEICFLFCYIIENQNNIPQNYWNLIQILLDVATPCEPPWHALFMISKLFW